MFKYTVFALAIAVAGLPVLAHAEVRDTNSIAAAPIYRV